MEMLVNYVSVLLSKIHDIISPIMIHINPIYLFVPWPYPCRRRTRLASASHCRDWLPTATRARAPWTSPRRSESWMSCREVKDMLMSAGVAGV